MRVLWHSNSPATAQTGYGVQSKLFTPRISGLGHDVAISAFYGAEGALQVWDGMKVFPKYSHSYGMDVAPLHAKAHGADITITLIDAWVMDPVELSRHSRWVPWFPVDHDPLPDCVADQVRESYQPVVFSRHALAACDEAGISAKYVPHGVDTSVYRPIPRDEARRRVGVDPDRFLVSCVMANKGAPSRKAWPQQLEAFAEFARRHPDALLYLHTFVGQEMQGVNIRECLQKFGVPPSQVLIADQYRLIIGIPDEVLASIYSASDVLLNCTMGEGFGVPILEAQACGTPVITGDWTAMSEITFAGWKVAKADATRWYTLQAAFQYIPHVPAIAEALEAAYDARKDPRLRERAVEGAAEYDADRVTDVYWRPLLDGLADRIAREDGNGEMPAPEVMAA